MKKLFLRPGVHVRSAAIVLLLLALAAACAIPSSSYGDFRDTVAAMPNLTQEQKDAIMSQTYEVPTKKDALASVVEIALGALLGFLTTRIHRGAPTKLQKTA